MSTGTNKFARIESLQLKTISLEKLAENDSFYFKSLQKSIEIKESMDDEGKPQMEKGKPVTLGVLKVEDLGGDEGQGEIVVGHIIRETLNKIPDLTGLCFEIVRGKKKNRTVSWSIYKIECPKSK